MNTCAKRIALGVARSKKCAVEFEPSIAALKPSPSRRPCGALDHNRRFFSSVQKDDSSSDGQNYQMLYQRNAERDKIPRAALGVSIFNTTYWSWYLLDFIPAVNNSPIEDLHIDPAVGFLGVGLGLLMNTVTILYPMSIVARLEISTPARDKLRVFMHDVPLIRPSLKPIEYLLGDLSLDPSSSDTKKILNKLNGDLKQYRGHLGVAIKGKRIPLLLEIREETELFKPQLLLQALINPQDVVPRGTRRTAPFQMKQAGRQASNPSKKKPPSGTRQRRK
jgi:hypothetical protein